MYAILKDANGASLNQCLAKMILLETSRLHAKCDLAIRNVDLSDDTILLP